MMLKIKSFLLTAVFTLFLAGGSSFSQEAWQDTSGQDTTSQDTSARDTSAQDTSVRGAQVDTTGPEERAGLRGERTQEDTSGISPEGQQETAGTIDTAENGADSVTIWISEAKTLIDSENYEEAERLVRRARESDSANAEVHFLHGRILHSTERTDEAIAAYQKSIELDDQNPYALNNLALLHIQQRNFEEAVPLLEKAIELKNDVAFFHNNLGIAYEGLQQYDRAVQSFQMALQIDPEHTKARDNLERVQEQAYGNGTEKREVNGQADTSRENEAGGEVDTTIQNDWPEMEPEQTAPDSVMNESGGRQ